mmetsp:Transcript_4910/g.16086  ORF Transcript_4910/g.16086 Transcript_4910/m.16086 type:complete len:310 (+) Transcript_4910:175-1104(+)
MQVETRRQKGYDLIRCTPPQSRDLVVVLPGNPGIAEYYLELAKEVAAGLSGTSVAVVGWLGFSATTEGGPRGTGVVDLESQIQHGRRTLGELLVTNGSGSPQRPPRKVALVGHSIGALVAAEILKAPPSGPIDAVVKVTPFVAANDESPAYRRKVRLTRAPGVGALVVAFAAVLRWLPPGLRRTLMAAIGQKTSHMNPTAATLTVEAMTRPENLRAMLDMGRSEFDSPKILHGPDLSWIPQHRDKVAVVYASGDDHWVRANAEQLMKQHGVETVTIHSDHDVPTRIDTSKACAAAIADLLKKRGVGLGN